MKNVMTLALTLALSASAAFAADHMTQVAAEARELASDYRKMTVTLKNKNFPAQELRDEMKDAEIALTKVKGLVNKYQASNPSLTAAQQKDWKLVQDLVALMAIFQNRKTELLDSGDPHKKRGSIQAEAQALVTRATLLEQAALRLAGGKLGS